MEMICTGAAPRAIATDSVSATMLLEGIESIASLAWGVVTLLEAAGSRLAIRDKWFQNGSVNITVKNVPEPVYRVIKREAKKNGRSLNAEIIQTLETEAAEAERRRQLRNLRKELELFAATLPPLDDSTPLIRKDRER
jgi:ubiquinone/menaquinone biosynthesis C-methylase UbiE